MPKPVMPSGAKNGKVSEEKKRKSLAVSAKTPRLKRFFFSKAFKQHCQNSGVNQSAWKWRWKSRHKFRSTFHTQPGWPYWHVIFPVFLFAISGLCLLFGWMLFLAKPLSSPGVAKPALCMSRIWLIKPKLQRTATEKSKNTILFAIYASVTS